MSENHVNTMTRLYGMCTSSLGVGVSMCSAYFRIFNIKRRPIISYQNNRHLVSFYSDG